MKGVEYYNRKMHERVNNQKGYTLLELIIVIGIISILVTMVLPIFERSIAQYRLRGASMQLASDIRLVRQQSIFGKALVVNLQVSPSEGFYLIRDSTRIKARRVLPPGVEFTGGYLNKSNVIFTLTGAPDSGGRIVLKNSFGDTCQVYIMPSSGRVRVDCSFGQ